MAGAVMTDSTLPPQCGHFFRCGPLTGSILSVWRPHFWQAYSYNGKRGSLLQLREAMDESDYNTRGKGGLEGVVDSGA